MIRKIIKSIFGKLHKITESGKEKQEIPDSRLPHRQLSVDTKGKSLLRKKTSQSKFQSKERSHGHFKSKISKQNGRFQPGTPKAVRPISKQIRWDISQFQVPPAEGKARFQDFDLPHEIIHAIADSGFRYCTPIQAKILPKILSGNDASGRAQTGTGKTAAFLIAIFAKFIRNKIPGKKSFGAPRALIIAPTRELVLQIAKEAHVLSKYSPLKIVTVFGGMDYEKQRKQLFKRTVDIVVATPGRLLDFQSHNDLNLGKVEILVIDEADRMLDMGFIPDVRRIINSLPSKTNRQTLFFSATLTPEVTRLCSQWTRDPVIVEIEPKNVAADTVKQLLYIVTAKEKYALLYNIITRNKLKRVIIFCNRRDETRKLADQLYRNRINCAFLSGEVPQKKRIKTLEEFRAGKIKILVATDVAGRGIHVDGVSHVINYTLPHDPEDYVHRIGRTGRAGVAGTSVSFACEEDSPYIPDIEKFIGHELRCIQPENDWFSLPSPASLRQNPQVQKSGAYNHNHRSSYRQGTRHIRN